MKKSSEELKLLRLQRLMLLFKEQAPLIIHRPQVLTLIEQEKKSLLKVKEELIQAIKSEHSPLNQHLNQYWQRNFTVSDN